jgi:chromosome segregation ATPase
VTERHRCRWTFCGYVCLFVGILLVAGCAISNDPRQGGFISGVAGLTSGSYQTRVDEKERIYHTELSKQDELHAEAERIRRERAEVRADLNRTERRLNELERSIRKQRLALKRQGATSAAAREKLQNLDAAQKRLSSTKARVAEAKQGNAPVSDARADLESVKSDVDDLDDIVSIINSSGF